jgi:sulfur carrier protein ThiS
MPVITFNAFSFLQKKLKEKHIEYSNVTMKLESGITAKDLIQQVQLTPEDVEVVLINGKVAAIDTIIQDKDRVALVPPGTPGPYRVLLGFKNKKNNA